MKNWCSVLRLGRQSFSLLCVLQLLLWQDMSLTKIVLLCNENRKRKVASQAESYLAHLGDFGKSPQNIQRQLSADLTKVRSYVEPTMIDIQIDQGQTIWWPVIAPHEWYHMLHSEGLWHLATGDVDLQEPKQSPNQAWAEAPAKPKPSPNQAWA